MWRFFCDTCSVICNTAEALKQHEASERHRSKVALLSGQGSGQPARRYHCKLCSCSLPSEASLQQHRSGKRHRRQMKSWLHSGLATARSAQWAEIISSCSGQSAVDDKMTNYRSKRLSGDSAASVLDNDSDGPARFERSVRQECIYRLQLAAGYASSLPLGSRVPYYKPEADFVQMPVRQQRFQLPPSFARLDPAPPVVPQNAYQLQQSPGQCTQKQSQRQERSQLSIFLQILGDTEHGFRESQSAEQHSGIKGSMGGYNGQPQHSQPGPSMNGSAKSSQAGSAAAGPSARRRLWPPNSSPQAELVTNGQSSRQQTQPSNSFDTSDDFLDGLLLAQAAAGNKSARQEKQGKQGQNCLLGSLLGFDQPTSMTESQQTDEQKLLAVLMDPSAEGSLLPDGGLLQNADGKAEACLEQANNTAIDSLLGSLLLADSFAAEPQTSEQPENGGPVSAAASPQRLPECISDPVWSESADLTAMLSLLGVSARESQEGEAPEGRCNGVDAQPEVDAKTTGHSSTAISTGQETPASKTADPAQDRPGTNEDPFLAELLPRLSNAHSLAADQHPATDLHSLLFGDEPADVTPDKQAADYSATGYGSTTPHAMQQSLSGTAAGCDGSSQSSGSHPCSFSEWLQMPSPVSSPTVPAVAPECNAIGPAEPAVVPKRSASGPAEPAVVPTGGAQSLSCILCGHTAASTADLVAHITSEEHRALKQLLSARRTRSPQKSSPGSQTQSHSPERQEPPLTDAQATPQGFLDLLLIPKSSGTGSSSHASEPQAPDVDESFRKHEKPFEPAMEVPEESQIFFDEEYHAKSPIAQKRRLEAAFPAEEQSHPELPAQNGPGSSLVGSLLDSPPASLGSPRKRGIALQSTESPAPYPKLPPAATTAAVSQPPDAQQPDNFASLPQQKRQPVADPECSPPAATSAVTCLQTFPSPYKPPIPQLLPMVEPCTAAGSQAWAVVPAPMVSRVIFSGPYLPQQHVPSSANAAAAQSAILGLSCLPAGGTPIPRRPLLAHSAEAASCPPLALEEPASKAGNADNVTSAAAADRQDDIGSRLSEMEEMLICPITHEIMVNPMVAEDRCTYEGMAIRRWLLLKQTSPMTGRPMGPELVSNQFLCNLSKAYRACVDNNTRAV